MKNYNLAKEYYKENKNLLIFQKYETSDGVKLGSWISNQRQKYGNTFLKNSEKINGMGILTKEQIKLLESIGMIWSIK